MCVCMRRTTPCPPGEEKRLGWTAEDCETVWECEPTVVGPELRPLSDPTLWANHLPERLDRPAHCTTVVRAFFRLPPGGWVCVSRGHPTGFPCTWPRVVLSPEVQQVPLIPKGLWERLSDERTRELVRDLLGTLCVAHRPDACDRKGTYACCTPPLRRQMDHQRRRGTTPGAAAVHPGTPCWGNIDGEARQAAVQQGSGT